MCFAKTVKNFNMKYGLKENVISANKSISPHPVNTIHIIYVGAAQ